MAGIGTPPEILRQIFSYLPFSDTVNVGRVSRQWHACSQEQLYSKLQLMQQNSFPTLLLRTLLTPGLERLATYVRTLNVNWRFLKIRPMHACDTALLEEAAARIGLSDIVRSTDDQILLLLHLLPRLDVLTLQPLTNSPTIPAAIGAMHQPGDLPLALRCVRHFSFLDFATADMLRTMLRLPRIRTLRVWFFNHIGLPFTKADRYTSGVTELRLSLSRVDNLSVRHLLQIPRALIRLTLSVRMMRHTAQLAPIHDALEPVRMTLEQLNIYTVESTGYREEPTETFLLLRTWPVLRKLWCPLNWLLGRWTEGAELHLYSVLPGSMRELALEGDQNWTHDRLVGEVILLLERKGEGVPMLERVCIKQKESELEQQLCHVCRDAGVVFAQLGDW